MIEKSYSQLMGETNAYLTITLDLDEPVEISDFASLFAGIGGQFDTYLKEHHPDMRGKARMYVKEVRRGSIVADLVPSVPDLVGLMDTALIVLGFASLFSKREALAAETADHMADGEVEIDGAYFGGHVRPENRKEDRKDRRRREHRSDRRRVVIALRERKGRTLSFVRREEDEGVAIARARMVADAKLFADEATHWDTLEMHFPTGRINHSEAYSDLNGKHTNNVESYFSRLRRMVQGQHHHVSHKYLYQYANHAAWMEDHRRRSNGGNAMALLGGSLAHPVSRAWKGYWQRAEG